MHATAALAPPAHPQHVYNLITDRQDISVSGTLLNAPEIGEEKSRFLLAAQQLHTGEKSIPTTGKIRLSMPGSLPPDIQPGDDIIVRGKLSRPRSYGTPGSFDYQSYLAHQDIWISGWIYSPYLIQKVHTLPPKSIWEKIPFLTEQFRQHLGEFISNALPSTTSGIYKAILIGDRSGVPDSAAEQYKKTGAIHLLAISGMHMGLLALTIGVVISWCLKRSERVLLKWPVMKFAATAAILPLALYSAIAGFNTPVFRALIMAYIFIGALLFNRQWSITNNIAIAALIILSINPCELYTVSFQLSFAAVTAIALVSPTLTPLLLSPFQNTKSNPSQEKNPTQRLLNFCIASIGLSIAATIGTAPLLAFHFNRVSLLSPVTTLLIEPFLCLWALLLGLIASLCLPLPTIATTIFQIGAWGITMANTITAALSDFPFASLWIATPSYLFLAMYYGLLPFLFFLWTKNRRKHTSNPAKKNNIILTTLIIAASLYIIAEKEVNEKSQTAISVLDVGQGLAVVIEFPDGKTFLLDGGKTQISKKSRFDVGRDLIAPFLWQKRITKLEGIIISHPHSDHFSGIPFLIEHFTPQTIWINAFEGAEPAYNSLLDTARQAGITIQVANTGTPIYNNTNRTLTPIPVSNFPVTLEAEQKDSEINNNSLIMKLNIGKKAILFPGDIERQAEETIIEQQKDVRADILIAPHHGSSTSNSIDFINRVSGTTVIFSAEMSQWGKFPSLETITKYRQAGWQILSTGQQGSIFITTDGKEINIETYNNGRVEQK